MWIQASIQNTFQILNCCRLVDWAWLICQILTVKRNSTLTAWIRQRKQWHLYNIRNTVLSFVNTCSLFCLLLTWFRLWNRSWVINAYALSSSWNDAKHFSSLPPTSGLWKMKSIYILFKKCSLFQCSAHIYSEVLRKKKFWNTFNLHAIPRLQMKIYFSSFLTFLLLFLTLSSTNFVYLNNFVYFCKFLWQGWFVPFFSHARSTGNKILMSELWKRGIN